MNSSNTNLIDRPAWAHARKTGKALVSRLGETEFQVDFYFFGCHWRLWACNPGAAWLLRMLNPGPYCWLPLNEGALNGRVQLNYPQNGPMRALTVAKENIFCYRYFKETPTFNERDFNYGWLHKGVETSTASGADKRAAY